MKILIPLEVEHCGDCPLHTSSHIPGFEHANDYFCTLTNRMIAGYVEWPSELKRRGIPDWCPGRTKETNRWNAIIE